jgi:superfamily II DNA/RNA helicase
MSVGKTAAFVLPILERLLYRDQRVPTTRVLILTPTRHVLTISGFFSFSLFF